jgi:hypothetical protein
LQQNQFYGKINCEKNNYQPAGLAQREGDKVFKKAFPKVRGAFPEGREKWHKNYNILGNIIID